MSSVQRFLSGLDRPQSQQARRTSNQADFKECVPIVDSDGNITSVLNTKTGKLEAPGSKQEKLVFNSATGKLGIVQEGINTDNQIQLGMAEDGFFIL